MTRRSAVLTAGLVLQILLLALYYSPHAKGLVGDEVTYLEWSAALQRGEPLDDTLRAPLYPYFLAALGANEAVRLPAQLLQIALLFCTALLFGDISRHLFGSRMAADLTIAAILLYPTLASFSHYFWPEMLHLALWGAAFWVLASRRRAPGWLLLAGLLLAIAALTRHLLLPFLPLVVVALYRDLPTGQRSRLAWITAPLVLVLGSALWADRQADGALRSESNAGFNLWVGLNDTAKRDFEDSIVYREYLAYLASAEAPTERNRLLRQRTRDLVAEQGVPATVGRQLGKQYLRLLDHGSFFTEQLSGGRIHREGGYGTQSALVTTALRLLNGSLYVLILIAGIQGIARAPLCDSRWLRVALLFIAYNLALFLLLHVKSRYRIQPLPYLILFAAPAVEVWWHRLRGERPPPLRYPAAVALATALVLFLAFGATLLG